MPGLYRPFEARPVAGSASARAAGEFGDMPQVAALARARKAATLVRLRQDSEQNRRDAFRETST